MMEHGGNDVVGKDWEGGDVVEVEEIGMGCGETVV